MAGATSSISELLGLNSPRGLLNVGNSQTNGLSTPPASSLYYQVSEFEYVLCIRNELLISLGSGHSTKQLIK